MNPFDFFDDIFCINLPSAGGRWREMLERFHQLRIDQYLKKIGPAVIVHPALMIQPWLLPYADPAHQFHFTI